MTPQELKHAAEQIKMNEEIQARVLRRILESGKEVPVKRQKNWKRIALAATAAVVILTVTAVASNWNRVSISWADSDYTYETLDEAQKAVKAVGSNMVLPEELLDYAFQGAYTNYKMSADTEDGRSYTFVNGTEQQGVSCDYEKENSKVTLTAVPVGEEPEAITTEAVQIVEEGELILEGGADGQAKLYTLPYVYKEEPLIITVDASPIEMSSNLEPSYVEGNQEGCVKTLSWTVDGMQYTLSQTDGDLGQADLTEMAQMLMEQE